MRALVLYLTIYIFQLALCMEELLFVVVIARHGARTMEYSKYFDIVDNNTSVNNPGTLTDVGKHQLYLLGKYLADKYIRQKKFLAYNYNSKEIHVRSSGRNKTIESAQSILQGLYQAGTGPFLHYNQSEVAKPPIEVVGIESIIKELRDGALPDTIQVTPIHTTNEVKDYYFSPHTECKSLENEKDEYDEKGSELDKEYAEFYKKLYDDYKINATSIIAIYELYDNIVAALVNDMKLNKNITPEDLATLRNATIKGIMEVFLHSEKKIKYMGHTILYDIITHFNSSKDTKIDERLKLTLFLVSGAHLYALSKVFSLEYNELVPFASSLIFELITDNDKHKVRAIYNGKEIRFDDYELFIERLEKYIFPSEAAFIESCTSDPPFKYDRKRYETISLILLFIFLAVLGGSWVLVLYNKKELFNGIALAPSTSKKKSSKIMSEQDFGGIFSAAFFDEDKDDIKETSKTK